MKKLAYILVCVLTSLGAHALERDLAVTQLAAHAVLLQVGEPVTLHGVLENHGTETAVQPSLQFSIDGQVVETLVLKKVIVDPNEGQEFDFQLPTAVVTTDKTALVEVRALWRDGQPDDNEQDNTAAVEVDFVMEQVTRKVVVEEATGTWCGWCPRGIVGLREMKADYPDRFIGIAVHNHDDFVYAPYDEWMTPRAGGYPMCLLNRMGTSFNPLYGNLEAALAEVPRYGEAELGVEARLDGDVLHMRATTNFLHVGGHEMRVAFVVLEDGVRAVQTNYYSGSFNPMGGFEEMDMYCAIELNDIARYISAIDGDEGSLPARLVRRQDYVYQTSVDLTALGEHPVADYTRMSVVAMLIDAETGEVMQAEVTDKLDADFGTSVAVPRPTVQPARIYDFSGRRLATAPARGIYVKDGRKYIR